MAKSHRTRRTISIIGIILVLATVGGTVYYRITTDSSGEDGSSAGEDELPSVESVASAFSAQVAIPVAGAEVVRDTLVMSVTAGAQAEASRRMIITAQVAGRVDSTPKYDGETVRAGQRLLTLDSREFELALAEAEASYRTALANYRETVLFSDRIQDPGVRAAREEAARSKSGLDGAQVRVERAELDLARSRIDAPFGGRVASVRVVRGEWVEPGKELMTLVDIDTIKVEVQVLADKLAYLTVGSDATITFSALPDTAFTGRVATINPVVAPESRTAVVTVYVENPDGLILPGMYARVALEGRRYPDRVLVPRLAVLERSTDRRTMLFVYEPGENGSGLAKWRYVTTGLSNDSLVSIIPNPETSMVEPGEIVLVDGHYSLTHDAPVRLVEDVAEAGGRPQ